MGEHVSLSEIEMKRENTSPDIALFTAALEGGGAERLLINLSEFFTSKGFKVDLVVCKYVGELRDQVPTSVRVVSLDASRVVFSLPAYLRYLKLVKPKMVISSVERPSIVAGFGRILSSHRHKFFIRTENTFVTSLPLWKQLYRLPWLFLVSISFWAADGIFAISSGIVEQLAKIPTLRNVPVHFVYNPLIHDNFGQKMNAPPEFPDGIDREKPIIIGVGRLHPQKDFANLINAFAKVYQKKECQLLILGDGPLRLELENLARSLGVDEKVFMPGFVKNPLSIIHHSNVFVLSSAWEGLPGVLIEALTTGTPIVSTDCRTGPKDILQDGRYGKLISVGNSEALAEGILEALDSPRRVMTPEVDLHLKQFRVDGVGNKYIEIMTCKK